MIKIPIIMIEILSETMMSTGIGESMVIAELLGAKARSRGGFDVLPGRPRR